MTILHLKLVSHKLCPYVQRARIVLAERPSVRAAVVPDYVERLHRFFVGLGSELTHLIGDRRVA